MTKFGVIWLMTAKCHKLFPVCYVETAKQSLNKTLRSQICHKPMAILMHLPQSTELLYPTKSAKSRDPP